MQARPSLLPLNIKIKQRPNNRNKIQRQQDHRPYHPSNNPANTTTSSRARPRTKGLLNHPPKPPHQRIHIRPNNPPLANKRLTPPLQQHRIKDIDQRIPDNPPAGNEVRDGAGFGEDKERARDRRKERARSEREKRGLRDVCEDEEGGCY